MLHEFISQLDLTQILLFVVTTVGGAKMATHQKILHFRDSSRYL